MNKIWKVKPPITEEFQNKFPEINPVILQLLHNRGLADQASIDEFLNPDYEQDIHDPKLFKDMGKAVDRIIKAIDQKQKVVVHGDYDADGVTSTAVLVETLKQIGMKEENFDIYIPHRNTEGYGLNMESVRRFVQSKVDLIITTDCGISNEQEVKLAQSEGIDVIVTDHHQIPGQLPPALAIINPRVKTDKYPFKELAGVGVAFKLSQALLLKKKINSGFVKWLLDLVAIGSVADSVPLLGENRTLVRYGLMVLNKTRRNGLLELMKKSRTELGGLDARSISFRLAPRLNAAGRLDHANTAYKLLISQDENTCRDLADQLHQTNLQRQQLTEVLTKEANVQVKSQSDNYVLFVEGQDQKWQPGIVGLIAGKISDQYFRPTFVITKKDDEYVGSGRSIQYLDIMAALKEARQYLTKFGGHSQACGFTVVGEDNLAKFKEVVSKFIEKQLKDVDLRPQLEIETKINLDQVNWNLFEQLELFRPFGQDNPKPLFLSEELTVAALELVGQDKKHLKLLVKESSATKKLIGFGFGKWAEKLQVGDKIKVIYEVDVNEWNGNRELQLKIIDLKK